VGILEHPRRQRYRGGGAQPQSEEAQEIKRCCGRILHQAGYLIVIWSV
jgi:hypothetical protein